jgi:hypothetical protein
MNALNKAKETERMFSELDTKAIQEATIIRETAEENTPTRAGRPATTVED